MFVFQFIASQKQTCLQFFFNEKNLQGIAVLFASLCSKVKVINSNDQSTQNY